MFKFDLTKTAIFQAVRWERNPIFRFVKIFKKLFGVLSLMFFLLVLYGLFANRFTTFTLSAFLDFSIIFFCLFLIEWLKESFLNSKLKQPKLKISILEALSKPGEYNLAEFLDFNVARDIWHSMRFAKSKKLSEINSSVLFFFLLKNNRELEFIFSRALLDSKEIRKILDAHFKILKPEKFIESFSQDFQDTILQSLKIAQEKDKARVEIGDVFTALARHDLVFKKILIDSNLKARDIENLVWWLEYLKRKTRERKRWWEYNNLIRRGSLAKEWTAGFTVVLDQFSIDWSEEMKRRGFPEIIGHTRELAHLERILANPEINNVLLVGEPGTGRKSIFHALTVKSFLGQSLPEINHKRVKELDLPSLLAQTENKEKVEATLDRIFKEVISAGNIILIIDEFHNFVAGGERPGVIDISGLLTSYLQYPQFQIIAVTTFAGLHRNIEQNPSFLALFEKVEVSEISERETLILLENLALAQERKYKKFVSYVALRDIINYAKRYYPNLTSPEREIDLLNEAMIYLLGTKESMLLSKHIARIVSERIEIPVGEIETKEREILLNLENLIHQRIINQEEAVKEVAACLRRARAEVKTKKGPMGCFLFLGPTGVGKTETAKALTEIYFGSEERMIRLDMSEFQAIPDIPRLIGAPDQVGLLTTQVRENPFSSILLDEIEKSHPNILNLFLQVLDEGFLTDGLGRKIDFQNSIIIATSNAGYKIILKALKEKTEWSQVKELLLDYLFEKGIFRPEFINRFDAVVVFKPLTKENLLDIADLMFQKLRKNLQEKDVEFVITNSLKEKIVHLSYSPVFGAREMKRVIQDKVENAIALALLSGKLKRGNRVEVLPENFELNIR